MAKQALRTTQVQQLPTRFSDWLIGRRKVYGYSQQDVGDAIGVGQNTISHWENGIHTPRAVHVAALAELFRVDPAVIWEEIKNPLPPIQLDPPLQGLVKDLAALPPDVRWKVIDRLRPLMEELARGYIAESRLSGDKRRPDGLREKTE